MSKLRQDADAIIQAAITAAQPDEAVRKALEGRDFGSGRVVLVAAGKGAWQMANAASRILGSRIDTGIVITKYDHSKGPIANFTIREAGHPIPDENSFTATQQALDLVSGLTAQDTVLFLLSGGGSALFEKPLIPAADLEELTHNLLVCGADIVEINTLRKRFSGVKGGRFAQLCAPAHVVSIVLSDILGDPLDMIASGPAYPDSSTCAQAKEIVQKYHLPMTDQMLALLEQETPKALDNVETQITGSVRQLCAAAAATARTLGYEPLILTDCLSCEAREAGVFLANMVRYQRTAGRRIALIAGGETVVHLTGHGKGGRNQELALAAAPGIAGLDGCAVFSVGSDGTDGPTDAAGGFVDSTTQAALKAQGCDIFATLADNDAYHALQKCNGLIITGPTGTTSTMSRSLWSGRDVSIVPWRNLADGDKLCKSFVGDDARIVPDGLCPLFHPIILRKVTCTHCAPLRVGCMFIVSPSTAYNKLFHVTFLSGAPPMPHPGLRLIFLLLSPLFFNTFSLNC